MAKAEVEESAFSRLLIGQVDKIVVSDWLFAFDIKANISFHVVFLSIDIKTLNFLTGMN